MNKKTKVLLFIIGVIALIFTIFFVKRVRQVNNNVPTSFEISQYKENEKAKLENVDVTVLNHYFDEQYHYDGGNSDDQYEYTPIVIQVKVQNNTSKLQEISMISQSALHVGYNYYNTREIVSENTQLAANQETILTFTYTVESKYLKNELLDKDPLKFVLGTNFLTSFDRNNYIKLYNEKKIEGIIFTLT